MDQTSAAAAACAQIRPLHKVCVAQGTVAVEGSAVLRWNKEAMDQFGEGKRGSARRWLCCSQSSALTEMPGRLVLLSAGHIVVADNPIALGRLFTRKEHQRGTSTLGPKYNPKFSPFRLSSAP